MFEERHYGAAMKTTTKSTNRTKAAKHPAAQPNKSKTQLVHFEFHDPAARKVCIAGTFNGWHPEVSEMIRLGSGLWAKDLELPPGAYEYRLVVDGKWIADPKCARSAPNPFGETNSLLVVAAKAPAARETARGRA
jgi:1,4-alpha-glucan branching enzyme